MVSSSQANGHSENDRRVPPALAEVMNAAPLSVQTLISVIREAPFPMFMVLGPERRLVYNDAYVPVLGRHHPDAMGRSFFSVWPEVQDVIEPVIARAFSGESTRFEDLPVVLHRPEPDDAWFTFSYSPVRDETDTVVGALCVCTETTGAVRARRRQEFLIDLETAFREHDDPLKIIEVAQAALGRHLGVARVGYGAVDAGERYFTTRGNWTDGSVPHHNGTHDLAAFGDEIFTALRKGVSLVIDDALIDPRAQSPQASAAFEALQIRSVATVSLIKGGRFVAALYLHHHQPKRWSAQDVELIQDVAERTWSAVERAHAQADLRSLARTQAFLLKLGDKLRSVGSAERIKEIAAQLLGEHLGVSRVGYGEIDESQTQVAVEKDWTDGSVPSLAGETRPLEVFGPAIIAELKLGRVVRIDSVIDHPVASAYAEGYASIDARSLLVTPLLKADRLIAILYLHEPAPRAWTAEDTAIATEVAERTWAAVERARAEEAARRLNDTLEERVAAALAERALFAGMVADTDAPIQMIDRDYRFMAINPAAQDHYLSIYGVRPDVGDSLLDLLKHAPGQRREVQAVWGRALAGEAFDQLAWWGEDQHERRAYEMRFRPFLDARGEVTGAYLIGRDVTDLLRDQERLAAAEEQLRQAQKMEAMGQLTGGVAHDFNNLLTPIVGSLDMLQRKGLGGEREQRLIAGAAQAAERAKVLVQRLLAFARRQPLQTTAVDMGDLVRGMADLIASTAGPQIKVAVEAADALPPARADRNQLEMALLNLAVNARDAMPNGGTLRITAEAARRGASLPPGLSPGDYVRLSVADTGVGMDEVTLKRAVEPFFSTKGVGQGTGLGLSMVHGLASQLGGALTIQSRRGVGTNVELWLPTSAGGPAPEDRSAADAPKRAGSGVALVVDDEDLARMSTSEMLLELGYRVVEATSAEGALQHMAEGLDPDLLVTDHLMAGMSGTELARTVAESSPHTRILIVSGYAEVDDIAPDLPRLAKPFRTEELAAALAQRDG
jgi:signal transduction histidine kinase/GAF domain-containing protein/CheY-like chemotaxis protein